jgi:hypothetical protein
MVVKNYKIIKFCKEKIEPRTLPRIAKLSFKNIRPGASGSHL